MRRRQGAVVRFDHPQVGRLQLNREKLTVGETDAIMLVIYHPDPATGDADKLALLASAALSPAAPSGSERRADH